MQQFITLNRIVKKFFSVITGHKNSISSGGGRDFFLGPKWYHFTNLLRSPCIVSSFFWPIFSITTVRWNYPYIKGRIDMLSS